MGPRETAFTLILDAKGKSLRGNVRHPPLQRFAMSAAGLVAAGAAVAWMSAPGREFIVFARESVVEVKKVVWPTRKETVQTTAAVFAFVLVMAVFLWVSDKTLEWVLYDLILGWKKT